MKKINKIAIGTTVLAAVALSHATADTNTNSSLELEPMEVQASFRESELQEIPGNVSVYDAAALRDSGAIHFQDIIKMSPNLNFSGGTSRPRFLQIRGIGELDQYDEPVVPSVGFIVDDIDFSGIAGSANLFDIDQVEILRGPQGSLFGANAMAGLVNIKSTDPTPYLTGKTHASYGTYDTRSLGVAIGGPLTKQSDVLTYRLSLHDYYTDGYIDNETLDRDDTDKKDEFSSRLKLRWRPSSELTVDMTGMYLDYDNGYDAFSFEDAFTTQSNDPGKDKQETRASSIRATWTQPARFDVLSITAAGDTDSEYRFDADWGTANDFEAYRRNRKFASQEIRLLSKPSGRIFKDSTDWILGVYTKHKDEHADEHQKYGEWKVESANDYKTDVYALYGQLEHDLSQRARVILGSRGEHRDTDYDDTYGAQFSPNDNMVGGNLSFQYDLSDENMGYATVARGYKGSGFNPDPTTPEVIRVYNKEHLWNFEMGIHNDMELIDCDLSVFYTRRTDPQIKWWDPGPPWVPYTINGEKGYNYGADANARYWLADNFSIFARLGLLKTKIYSDRIPVLADGREQSHAPNYQFSTGIDYKHPAGYTAHLELVGSDGFEFDNYYNAQSSSHEIVNARIGYETMHWAAYLWGRNVFDETYAIRGLNLGDIYTQKGAPALFGATLDCYF